MIFRVADAEAAVKELNGRGVKLVCHDEMAELFD